MTRLMVLADTNGPMDLFMMERFWATNAMAYVY